MRLSVCVFHLSLSLCLGLPVYPAITDLSSLHSASTGGSRCVCLSVCLSICLCLSVKGCLSAQLSLTFHHFTQLVLEVVGESLSLSLSICLCLSVKGCLSAQLSLTFHHFTQLVLEVVGESVCLSLSVHLSLSLCLWLPVYPAITDLSLLHSAGTGGSRCVCLFVSLSVCLSLSLCLGLPVYPAITDLSSLHSAGTGGSQFVQCRPDLKTPPQWPDPSSP